MASINDFKLLNRKCVSYFTQLEADLGETLQLPSETHKARFGFYLLMLESLCGLKDINEQIEIITDKEFNSYVTKLRDDDYGVDAIYIDEETNYINLFNFKYRVKFSNEKSQNLNETFLSTKLINSIKNGSSQNLNGKTKKLCEEVIEKLAGSEVWKLRLYVISNEVNELNVNLPEISDLKELYDLEIQTIGLEKITQLMSIRPESIDAMIHLSKDSILPFAENSLSSSISYILRISGPELLRVTCNNRDYREDYSMEDYSPLRDTEMDYNLLFDNVRGLIVNSKFNKNILDTLKEDPSRFFMYNNGLTITAGDIISEDTNANKKLKITIKDFQVVNGGQTLRTIHQFNHIDGSYNSDYLSQVQILLRVFKTPTESNLRNRIAQYTNSQNAISNVDLKSLSEIQIQIEQFLDGDNIIYARKVGDTGITPDREYEFKISMEKFGQILFSIQGDPHKASSQKKQIFDKYYDQIFGSDNFDITTAGKIVRKYFEVKKVYEEYLPKTSSDQKIFYILYLDTKLDLDLKSQIEKFEQVLSSYRTEEEISDARKLLNKKFKEQLDATLNLN